jgi:hypothetical protein
MNVSQDLTSKHSPPDMPPELWAKVLSNLELQDIKAARLAWRIWTGVAARFMFQPFIFKADRKDFERFDLVAQNPDMKAGIKHLRFEIGTMSIFWMSCRLGAQYMYAINSAHADPRDENELEDIEHEIKLATAEYAAWNVSWHNSGQIYHKVETLKAVFSQVNILERVDVTLKSVDFGSDLLLNAWISGSHTSNHHRAMKEFTAILLACGGSSTKLKHLSHDELPVRFFVCPKPLLLRLASCLPALQTLHLTFGATDTPHRAFWKGLGRFLCSIPTLEDLRFGFKPLDKGTTNTGDWVDTEEIEDWYTPLWKVFDDHTWENLRNLRIDGVVVCETGLGDFLERHAWTLKSLELCSIGLWVGGFRSLLSRLRQFLSLQTFRIWGVLRAFHSPDEAWRIWPTVKTDTEAWSETFKAFKSTTIDDETLGMPHCIRDGLDVQLQHYFISGGPWPMEPEDTLDFYIERFSASHHPVNCEGCALSTEELDRFWDTKIYPGLDQWERLTLEGAQKDSRGEELVEYYRGAGYDVYGFNREGYNFQGIHHTVAKEDWQGEHDVLNYATADRTVSKLIRSQIPRFQGARIYDTELQRIVCLILIEF